MTWIFDGHTAAPTRNTEPGLLFIKHRSIVCDIYISSLVCSFYNSLQAKQKENAHCIPLDDLTENFPQTHIPGAEVRYLEKERQEELLTAFQEMREEEKQLLYGKYLMDLSDAELAQMLGCKPSSVRMKLTRARRAFVEKLREGGKNHE